MNKWEKDMKAFHGVEYKIIKQDKRMIKYSWNPQRNDIMTAFVIKNQNKTIVIPSKSWDMHEKETIIYVRDMFLPEDKGHGRASWEAAWKKIGKCKFDYTSNDLDYVYNAIWVSMI